MPNYGTLPLTGSGSGQPATLLSPGDQIALFNAESPTPPQASIAVGMASAPGEQANLTISIEFSLTPTCSLAVQGSMTDTPAGWLLAPTIYTSTNKETDSYTDAGRWLYYRVLVSTWTGGGTLTAIARR